MNPTNTITATIENLEKIWKKGSDDGTGQKQINRMRYPNCLLEKVPDPTEAPFPSKIKGFPMSLLAMMPTRKSVLKALRSNRNALKHTKTLIASTLKATQKHK